MTEVTSFWSSFMIHKNVLGSREVEPIQHSHQLRDSTISARVPERRTASEGRLPPLSFCRTPGSGDPVWFRSREVAPRFVRSLDIQG